jgi:hypothetical protein
MSTAKKTTTDSGDLELRKVKALEKIANSLDALTIWFEDIDKDEWGDRAQYYLAEFHTKFVADKSKEQKSENE